jgi:polar amino acid transport system substrate-binding protein
MMIRLLTALLFALTTVSVAQSTEKIQYMTEQNPPYNFEQDGGLQGIAVELLLEMGKQAGQQIALNEIKMLPWPRGYRTLEKTPGTSLFSMARTEQREELFKWVGPIMDLTIGLVAPKDKKLKIESVNDLMGLHVGSIRDGAPEQLLLKAGFDADNLDRAPSPEQNIKKLVANRVDALAFNIDSTRYSMKSMGINPDEYETVYVLKQIQLYFAYNKETDDAFIDSMNAALSDLKKKDDTGKSFYDSLVSSYLDGK